jgi:hypothetical protein
LGKFCGVRAAHHMPKQERFSVSNVESIGQRSATMCAWA